jgi:hypothetical protein
MGYEISFDKVFLKALRVKTAKNQKAFISPDKCILKRELQAPYLIKYGDVTVVGRRSRKEGKINVVYGYMDLGTGKKR